jgi:hypothetical protein
MPKWAKMIVACLLLPACYGAAAALARVVPASGAADTTWVPIAGGAGCWLSVYLLLPKPMRLYILGHEFTHALWAWLFGGRVVKFKVGPKSGHVVLTKSNFIIALAPYFFPIYVVLVLAAFLAGHLLWNWTGYLVWFHLCLGAAYAFHVTLTWHILQAEQSDIIQEGYLFSAVVIFLGNVTVLLLGIPLLTGKPSVLTALEWWWAETAGVVLWLYHLAGG